MNRPPRPTSQGSQGSKGKANSSHPRRPRTSDQHKPADARSVALSVLVAVRERDAYANLVLPTQIRRAGLNARDAALATELSYGTLRAQGLLDRVISLAANREVTAIDAPVLDFLRLGTYQLLYTRIEAYAAVNTTVEAVRTSGLQKAGAFVNAVLRKISAQSKDQWIEEIRSSETDPIARLAAGTAHPEWIARAFAEALGPEAAELAELLSADDARPQVHLVARPGEISAEELALITGGEPGRYSPYAVYLDSGDPAQLEPVATNLAAVQDEGSQLVALACARMVCEGEDSHRWLDLCAGPGGKAALLGALALIDGASVTAVEVAGHRAELVRKATAELPVTVLVDDGRSPQVEPGFDRVLVDAPCSGLGSLRRRPESRWRRKASDISALVTLQRELLASALRLVRPGGVVVYATCSPHLSETVSIVREAARTPGVEILDVRTALPEVDSLGPGPWVQLWPHRHGTDAMFIAALRRT